MRKSLEIFVGSVAVYVAMAACSGGAKVASVGPAGDPGEASGGSAVAAEGGAPGKPSGGDGGLMAAVGGLLDPVSGARAQEGGGPGVQPGGVTYTKREVVCDQLIKVSGTNYPAAIVDIDPPSLLTAARTIAIAAPSTIPGWLQAGTGGFIKPDGSQTGTTCANKTDMVTFYVPEN